MKRFKLLQASTDMNGVSLDTFNGIMDSGFKIKTEGMPQYSKISYHGNIIDCCTNVFVLFTGINDLVNFTEIFGPVIISKGVESLGSELLTIFDGDITREYAVRLDNMEEGGTE